MSKVIETKIRPDFCKPGFAIVGSGLSDEQLRICYVMTSPTFEAKAANKLLVRFEVPNFSRGPIVEGATNLPDGTEFIVSLQTPAPACRPNCRMAQAKSIVRNGQFTAGPFGVNPGIYTLEITTGSASLQSKEIRQIIGNNGEHLSGPYIKPEIIPGAGPTVGYKAEIRVTEQ